MAIVRTGCRARGRLARRLLLGVVLAGPVACSDGTGPEDATTPSLTIELVGLLERGAVVSVLVSDLGGPLPQAEVELQVQPAQAAEVLPDGELRLTRAGLLTLTAMNDGPDGLRTVEKSIEVAVPPLVVFDMEAGGTRNLYMVRLDGEELVQLTSHTAADSRPTAANAWVVFGSVRGGNPDLYRMQVDGGAPERLTTNGSVNTAPALSADGARLAWVSDASGVPRLWTADPDGSGAAPATPDFGRAGAVEAGPSWDGSGRRIAFVSTETGTPSLYVLDVATGGVAPLLPPSPAPAIQPRWHPVRDEVAFVSRRDGEPGIFLLTVESGEVSRVTDGGEPTGDPAWIGEDRLVYTAWVPGGTELRWVHLENAERIHVIPLPGSSPRNPVELR